MSKRTSSVIQWPVKTIDGAIGPRHLDFLTIGNAWVDLKITRECDDSGAQIFECDGRGFPTLSAALDYAILELQAYQSGRAD